jgi:FkbM family methyltransferase
MNSVSNAVRGRFTAKPWIERQIFTLTQSGWLRRHLKTGWLAFRYGLRLDSPTVRTAHLDGYSLLVNIAEALGISSYFLGDRGVPWFLGELIREGDCCLDVGSNMGHYAAYLSYKVGPRGRVVAFEPQPFYASLISETILENRWDERCLLVQKAAASASGEHLNFFLSTNPHNSGVASLVNHGSWLDERCAITVGTTTLDEWTTAREFHHLRFAKIDVERAEEYVLNGACQLLARKAVDVWWIEMVIGSPSEILLESAGYAGFVFRGSGGHAVSIQTLAKGTTTDVLFVPMERIEEFRWILSGPGGR